MSLHTNSNASPAAAHHPLRPAVTLDRRWVEGRGPRDDVARGAAYRRFLWRTQNIAATALDYPGGMSALIGDREIVTLLLVELLRGR